MLRIHQYSKKGANQCYTLKSRTWPKYDFDAEKPFTARYEGLTLTDLTYLVEQFGECAQVHYTEPQCNGLLFKSVPLLNQKCYYNLKPRTAKYKKLMLQAAIDLYISRKKFMYIWFTFKDSVKIYYVECDDEAFVSQIPKVIEFYKNIYYLFLRTK